MQEGNSTVDLWQIQRRADSKIQGEEISPDLKLGRTSEVEMVGSFCAPTKRTKAIKQLEDGSHCRFCWQFVVEIAELEIAFGAFHSKS